MLCLLCFCADDVVEERKLAKSLNCGKTFRGETLHWMASPGCAVQMAAHLASSCSHLAWQLAL